jgi:mRNA interferase HigB
MHVINRPALRAFADKHADAQAWLEEWWVRAKNARWHNLDEVRQAYSTADQVDRCLVFDKGDRYRLIVRVSYTSVHTRGTLFVKHFLTHAEYSKNRWKECCK